MTKLHLYMFAELQTVTPFNPSYAYHVLYPEYQHHMQFVSTDLVT